MSIMLVFVHFSLFWFSDHMSITIDISVVKQIDIRHFHSFHLIFFNMLILDHIWVTDKHQTISLVLF